jgi:hypothetical protein
VLASHSGFTLACLTVALAEVIEHNAANYTAWQYRRHCVRELAKDKTEEEQKAVWREELAYCTEQCLDNMKNYQVWFHRRACISALASPDGELAFVAKVLGEDAKNYHAWGHRQWVLSHFGVWEGELEYLDSLLVTDVRNNSAWNQRYFVLKHTIDMSDAAAVLGEVDKTLACIARAPANTSPWAFLKGIVAPIGYHRFPQVHAAPPARAVHATPCPVGMSFACVPSACAVHFTRCARHAANHPLCRTMSLDACVHHAQVRAACEKLGSVESLEGATPASGATPCVEALSLLVDVLLAEGAGCEPARARSICEQLAKLDRIRERYWHWRAARCVPASSSAPAATDAPMPTAPDAPTPAVAVS